MLLRLLLLRLLHSLLLSTLILDGGFKRQRRHIDSECRRPAADARAGVRIRPFRARWLESLQLEGWIDMVHHAPRVANATAVAV